MKKYQDLKKIGIKKRYNLGLNKWDYPVIVLVLQDRSIWDLIPEFNKYERREGMLWNEGLDKTKISPDLEVNSVGNH